MDRSALQERREGDGEVCVGGIKNIFVLFGRKRDRIFYINEANLFQDTER